METNERPLREELLNSNQSIVNFKESIVEHKLKQMLKLICATAIGVIGYSDTGFIFNNSGSTLSLKRNEDIIEHNHHSVSTAIEIDIGMPP